MDTVNTTELSYSLPGFEGPLDLLLHLVNRHKLDILDIPIVELVDQYMETIEHWKSIDLDIATEFLIMASRLVYIKSCYLLPKHEEESDDLRQELSGELIEYELCQKTARKLAKTNIGGDLFVREPEEVELDMTYQGSHKPEELYSAFFSATGRGRRKLPPPPQAFTGIVAREIVSVSSKITYVLGRLYDKPKVMYHSLFTSAKSKSDLVATFLALLELIKDSRIKVDGQGEGQTVSIVSKIKSGN